MKKYNEFINENIRDLLTPKSEENILKNLDDMDDLERIQRVRSYNLNPKFLPPEENIRKLIDKQPNIFLKVFFVKRNKLPEKYMPSDEEIREELDKMTYKKRRWAIDRWRLPDKFLGKRSITQKSKTIQKINKIIKNSGPINNFTSSWILDNWIEYDKYDALILTEIRHDGIIYVGYSDVESYYDNFIKYEDMRYDSINFIMKIIKTLIKEGKIKKLH